MVLPGRGVVWLEYEPEIGTDENGAEIVVNQKVDDSFVYYRDFLHSPARCWAEVWWIARRLLMARDDMRDAGFKDAETIPLNWLPELEGGKEKEVPDALKRAEVWEIRHKSKKETIFVVEGHPKVARVDADPYGLSGFWPCAEPAQAITSNDSFVPSALFVEYEDQADDLDEITDRISKLTRALKRRGDGTRNEGSAFNDVVVSKAGTGRLIEFEVIIDNEYVYTQRSDGLVVATPTGSTAYALSAGGPILYPTLEAIALVPICPHILSARPIVVSSQSRVDIIIHHADDARVHFDGQNYFELQKGDKVSICRVPYNVTLLHPKHYSYYDTLRQKLHWGKQL